MMPSATLNAQSLREWGIVGAGGAGFPSFLKLSRTVDTVIVNAAECEPLLHKDKELLKAFPHVIVTGLNDVMEAVGAGRGIIAIKKKYGDVFERISPFVSSTVNLFPLGDFYPAGDEFVLAAVVTERIIPAGGLPPDVGVLIHNVETLFNIGSRQPVTTTWLTVAGDIPQSVTIGVPVGMPIADILSSCGINDLSRHTVLAGGAMMGELLVDMNQPVTKTTGGLIILPDKHPLIEKYRRNAARHRFIGSSCCDQCSLCTDLCPRFLLGHPIQPHLAMRALQMPHQDDELNAGSFYCCECNLCSFLSCPIDLDPKAICVQYKRTHQRPESPPQTMQFSGQHPMAAMRRVSLSRLIDRLGLKQYQRPAPLQKEKITANRVLLPLRGPFGVSAHPVVQLHDQVHIGQKIADVEGDRPGVPIHASIDGSITSLTDSIIEICAS